MWARSGWLGHAGASRPGAETTTASSAQWLPFEEARAFVRDLGLKSEQDWHKWCKQGNRPSNIPPSPQNAYKKSNWAGVRRATGMHPLHLLVVCLRTDPAP